MREVHALYGVRGEHPPEVNLERLMRLVPLPVDWQEQRKLLGMEI
jgi:hypothetical protein